MDKRNLIFIKDRRESAPLPEFLAGFGTRPFRGFGEGPFIPRLDIAEGIDQITVTAELPGVEEKDIHISATKNRLTIEGEKKTETEQVSGNLYRSERFYGSFRRDIPLPAEVNMTKAEALFKNGLLKLVLPKTERKISKPIPIKKSS